MDKKYLGRFSFTKEEQTEYPDKIKSILSSMVDVVTLPHSYVGESPELFDLEVCESNLLDLIPWYDFVIDEKQAIRAIRRDAPVPAAPVKVEKEKVLPETVEPEPAKPVKVKAAVKAKSAKTTKKGK